MERLIVAVVVGGVVAVRVAVAASRHEHHFDRQQRTHLEEHGPQGLPEWASSAANDDERER
jgi:hypothetical protein